MCVWNSIMAWASIIRTPTHFLHELQPIDLKSFFQISNSATSFYPPNLVEAAFGDLSDLLMHLTSYIFYILLEFGTFMLVKSSVSTSKYGL